MKGCFCEGRVSVIGVSVKGLYEWGPCGRGLCEEEGFCEMSPHYTVIADTGATVMRVVRIQLDGIPYSYCHKLHV